MSNQDSPQEVITGNGDTVYCGALIVVLGTAAPPQSTVIVYVGRSPGIIWIEQDRSNDDVG